jgi:hypothetical protein
MTNKTDDKANQKKLEKLKKILLIISISCLLVTLLLIYSYVTIFSGGLSQDHNRWGVFGDYIGGTLGAIFSFATLIAILYTISLQKEDLELTREEIKKSSEALEAQSKTLKIQRFENTFFELLRFHHDNVSNMKHPSTGKSSGFFPYYLSKHATFLYAYSSHNQPASSNSMIRTINESTKKFDKKFGYHFDLYLKNISLIIKLLDRAKEDRALYFHIFSSQFREDEFVLFLYFCFLDSNAFNFRILYQEDFFTNISVDLITVDFLKRKFKSVLKVHYQQLTNAEHL